MSLVRSQVGDRRDLGLSASAGVDLVYHLDKKWCRVVRTAGTLYRGLVHVACTLSNIDLNYSDALWERNFNESPGYIHIPSLREGKLYKSNAEIECTGPMAGMRRKCIVSTQKRTRTTNIIIYGIQLSISNKSKILIKDYLLILSIAHLQIGNDARVW